MYRVFRVIFFIVPVLYGNVFCSMPLVTMHFDRRVQGPSHRYACGIRASRHRKSDIFCNKTR